MARALLLLPLLFAGCLSVASRSYEASQDERSVKTQAADANLGTTIRKRILKADAKGLLALDVYCYQGNVVLVGVVPPGSMLGAKAVEIARGVDGVQRVDTYYVPNQPSKMSDLAISAKVKTKLVGDGHVKSTQLDWTVLGGHVVLVGVVDGSERRDRIVRDVRAIDGVAGVKSFLQIKPAER